MLRNILALFGLALASDLRRANIHREAAADIAMIWMNAATQIRDYAACLETLLPNIRQQSTTDNTPTQ